MDLFHNVWLFNIKWNKPFKMCGNIDQILAPIYHVTIGILNDSKRLMFQKTGYAELILTFWTYLDPEHWYMYTTVQWILDIAKLNVFCYTSCGLQSLRITLNYIFF